MCQHCTSIHPDLVEEATKKTRACIEDVIGRTDRLLRLCNNLEDCYRDIGIAFHKTECPARIGWEYNTGQGADSYGNLEKAFLNSSYEDIFAPLTDMVKRLTELSTRAQHVPSAADAGQLMLTLKHELLPRMNVLITEFEAFEQYISALRSDVHMLQMFNRQFYQVNELGHRHAWYDPVVDVVNNRRTVRCRFGEFTLFTDWVYSLPEAQRALSIQAEHDGFNPSGSLFQDRLFVYSMDLLWRPNEGVVPDRG